MSGEAKQAGPAFGVPDLPSPGDDGLAGPAIRPRSRRLHSDAMRRALLSEGDVNRVHDRGECNGSARRPGSASTTIAPRRPLWRFVPLTATMTATTANAIAARSIHNSATGTLSPSLRRPPQMRNTRSIATSVKIDASIIATRPLIDLRGCDLRFVVSLDEGHASASCVCSVEAHDIDDLARLGKRLADVLVKRVDRLRRVLRVESHSVCPRLCHTRTMTGRQ